MEVTFKNVENQKIIDSFQKVLKRYKSLKNYEISLVQKPIKSSTMQAQPVVNFSTLFSGQKQFKINLGIHVRDQKDLLVAELSEEVLTGWFAHELGHVVDYQQHSNWSMIAYGLRYLFSGTFRKKVEHDADYIAISHGFHEEILATKKYILEHHLIDEAYKDKIKKYYLPEADVLTCSKDKVLLEPYLNL